MEWMYWRTWNRLAKEEPKRFSHSFCKSSRRASSTNHWSLLHSSSKATQPSNWLRLHRRIITSPSSLSWLLISSLMAFRINNNTLHRPTSRAARPIGAHAAWLLKPLVMKSWHQTKQWSNVVSLVTSMTHLPSWGIRLTIPHPRPGNTKLWLSAARMPQVPTTNRRT